MGRRLVASHLITLAHSRDIVVISLAKGGYGASQAASTCGDHLPAIAQGTDHALQDPERV
ncbi:hypothetical protein GCM10011574_06790 [Microbispora bryophytorum]|uniref:Uncharacterized protein n=1 Tax=Microbispora bryophytorum TaxID=1460882 RepID=A0A8H9GW98_9ACTN|nr:hypothetical protein GCM10011574_06790 [Microbispora bryophytorum]